MEGRIHPVYRSAFPMPSPELRSLLTSRVRWLLRNLEGSPSCDSSRAIRLSNGQLADSLATKMPEL